MARTSSTSTTHATARRYRICGCSSTGIARRCAGNSPSWSAGYEDFRDFDWGEAALIEPLRTLRMIHHSAWIARRWNDPAFPAAFPWFGGASYWSQQTADLRDQLDAMRQPSLVG